MMEQPLDIKTKWMNVVRRMQSASKSEGLSVVSIVVLCDKDGEPIAWMSPKQELIEPKGNSNQLQKLLTEMMGI